MHAESMYRCITLAYHCNARLILFIVESSSTRFMSCMLFIGQSQHAFFSIAPWFSKTTPITRKLASTHKFISSPVTHQPPGGGSFWCTLVSISALGRAFFTVSYHPFVTMLAHLFIIPVTVRSHPQIGKCPTNFPQMENTLHCVSVMGSSRTEFSCFHHSVLTKTQCNSSISLSSRVLTSQTKGFQSTLDLIFWEHILVYIYVIDICCGSFFHQLILF